MYRPSLPLFDFFPPSFLPLFSFLSFLLFFFFNFDDTRAYEVLGCQQREERDRAEGKQDEGGAWIEATSAFRRENSEISGYLPPRVRV